MKPVAPSQDATWLLPARGAAVAPCAHGVCYGRWARWCAALWPAAEAGGARRRPIAACASAACFAGRAGRLGLHHERLFGPGGMEQAWTCGLVMTVQALTAFHGRRARACAVEPLGDLEGAVGLVRQALEPRAGGRVRRHPVVRLRRSADDHHHELLRRAMAPFLHVARRELLLKAPFRISGYVFTTSPVIVVTLDDRGASGRGEAAGVYYTGDTQRPRRAMLDVLPAARCRPDAGRAAPHPAARRRAQCCG